MSTVNGNVSRRSTRAEEAEGLAHAEAVAKATGESLAEIHYRGFGVADQLDVHFDPDRPLGHAAYFALELILGVSWTTPHHRRPSVRSP